MNAVSNLPNLPNDSSAPKRNERTCAGCGKHASAEELVRVVHDPNEGALAIDLAGSAFGRGAHVHASLDCVAKAAKGGFVRVLSGKGEKVKVTASAEALGEDIVKAADRRMIGLLGGAKRAGQLAIGADAAVAASHEDRAEVFVVASDAAAATKLHPVERAIASGNAIVFGDKKFLGGLFGRDEVAVVAILHSGVADATLRTYQVSGPFRVARASVGVVSTDAQHEMSEDAWSSSEVR
jgi:uncharacterized protein